jgi:regulator of protease activity HflC (stomatin/prohibitin superfamily)
MGTLTIMVIFAVLVMITIGLSVRIVPQGEKYVVQRLGKFHDTLTPGLNLLIPYIDLVAYKVSTKDIVLDIPSQEVITHDNAVIIANAVAYINIVNPAEAVYGVEDYELAIRNLIQTALRSIIGEMSLDDALSSRNFIKAKLKEEISDDIAGWGIILKTVEIQDIKPSTTMQQAMEEQAAAERERRAAVTKAEGEKQAAILEAEGRLEASKRDAQAQIELAKGQKQAINEVSSALSDKGDLPVVYLLGEKYIQSLETLSKSDNNKTLVMPSDIMTTVKGLLNRG